jgi:hypothetical protein
MQDDNMTSTWNSSLVHSLIIVITNYNYARKISHMGLSVLFVSQQ